MPIRGRYSPFNLTAFNQKLDHGLLIASSLLADDHPQYFADTTIGTRAKDYATTGTGTFGNITIFNPIPILVLKDSTYTGATSLGYIEWRDSNNTRLGFFGNASSGDDDLYWKNESSGGHIKIETTGAGEFQIFANTVLNGTVTATGDVTAGLARIGNVGGIGNLSSTSGDLGLISAGGIIYLGEDNALRSSGLIQTTDELWIGTDVPNRVEFTNIELAFRTTGDYVIEHVTDDKDILFKILDTIPVTLLQLDAGERSVKSRRDLVVNSDFIAGEGLILEGSGTMQATRGGNIEWKTGSGSTSTGFNYVASGNFVWKATAQSSATDLGVASLNFATGAFTCAGGDFDIDASGNIADVSDITAIGTLSNTGISKLGDGGTTNYAQFAADGSESFNGTAKLTLPNKTGSTTEGDLWKDTAQKSIQGFVAGVEQTLIGCIFTQTADQTIANTTTETTMFGTGVGTLTLPANFWTVGKTIRLEIHGDFADTGNPTAEVQVYQGATSLIDSGAITLSGLAGTEEWECHVVITCRSVGGSGTLETIIDWEYETSLGSSAIERLDVAGTTTVIDTTASHVLDATFQWGTAAAANTLISEIGLVEVIN